eukprot:12937146-Prorocentrum_lima.AAC.1
MTLMRSVPESSQGGSPGRDEPPAKPPSFGNASTQDIDSLKTRKKLPILNFGNFRVDSLRRRLSNNGYHMSP